MSAPFFGIVASLAPLNAKQPAPMDSVNVANLEGSELRYRRLFETARDGILILDDTIGAIVDANPFMTELLGYTHDELIGKELWEIGLQQDRAASRNAFQQLKREKYIRYANIPLETRRGQPKEVEFVSNIYPEGERSVIQCNIRDITERRKAEAALILSEKSLSLILQNIEDIVFLLTVDVESDPRKAYRILFVNPAFLKWTGLREKQIVGKYIQDVRRRITKTNILDKCAEAIGRRQPIAWQEISLSSQGERTGDVQAIPLFNENGVCSHIIGTIHDVTERKRVEAEKENHLREARDRADRDPLTGLLNHRALYNQLDKEAARAEPDNGALAIVMMDLDNFKFFNDVYGHATGDNVLRLVAGRLRETCRAGDTIARFGGDEFVLLLPNVGNSSAEDIEARMQSACQGLYYQVEGLDAAIPISISCGAALLRDLTLSPDHVLRQADERLYLSKTGGNTRGNDEDSARRVRADAFTRVREFSMLDALVTAVDNKDRYTRSHSETVMDYCLMIARELRIGKAEQRTIAISALLHDVGKIGVPDSILRKPGRLTEEEFEAIKQHPMMGAAIVSTVPALEEMLDAVRHHHERWDGRGYPSGLRGEKCPLHARLMAVADAYSAMTTDRPYRSSMDKEKALSILTQGAGTQWDPRCVGAFVKAMR